jgi:phage terminase small subunit
MSLNPKQQRFVAEYLIDHNATQAAIRAGYSAKTAASIGERLLRNVEIAAAVQTKDAAVLERLDVTAERVLEEIARVAFFKATDFFDADGNVLPVTKLTPAAAACIQQLDILLANVDAGDGKRDRIHRIKVADKLRALELLAKRFGLVKEKVEITGLNELVERLARARARVKK